MSSVILIRHGPVACDRPFFPDSADFAAFCAAYERSGLKPDAPPPDLTELCAGKTLFASAAPRARETALRLAPDGDWRFDTLFAEEPMRAPALPGRWPLPAWSLVSRATESVGAGAAPHRRALRERAHAAASLLAASAPSLLVGHGWFNRHIAAALKDMGFRPGKRAPSHAPWSAQVLMS